MESPTLLLKLRCQVFNERKCSTSDRRECDKAYGDGVTAIQYSDQDEFRKQGETNFQLIITFGQQCTAVLEDEERRIVNVKTFFLGGAVMFLHVGVTDVIKIVIVGYAFLIIEVVKIVIGFVSIILVSVIVFIQCGVVKIIVKGIVKIKSRKSKCKVKKQSQCDKR